MTSQSPKWLVSETKIAKNGKTKNIQNRRRDTQCVYPAKSRTNSEKEVIASICRIKRNRSEKSANSRPGLNASRKTQSVCTTPIAEFRAKVRAPRTDFRCQAKTVANEDDVSANVSMTR